MELLGQKQDLLASYRVTFPLIRIPRSNCTERSQQIPGASKLERRRESAWESQASWRVGWGGSGSWCPGLATIPFAEWEFWLMSGGRNYFGSSELQEKSTPVRGRALRPVPAGSKIQWQGHVRPRARCQAVRPPSTAPRALAVSSPPWLTWYLPRGFLGSDFNLLLCHKDNSPDSTAVVISIPDFQGTCQTVRVKSSCTCCESGS